MQRDKSNLKEQSKCYIAALLHSCIALRQRGFSSALLIAGVGALVLLLVTLLIIPGIKTSFSPFPKSTPIASALLPEATPSLPSVSELTLDDEEAECNANTQDCGNEDLKIDPGDLEGPD